jgi:hypothetical protein
MSDGVMTGRTCRSRSVKVSTGQPAEVGTISSPPPASRAWACRRDPLPSGQPPTQEFRIQGVMPGAYVVRAGGEWLVKSITWKGRDYTDRPIDAAAEPDLSGVDVTLTNAAPWSPARFVTRRATRPGRSSGSFPGPGGAGDLGTRLSD